MLRKRERGRGIGKDHDLSLELKNKHNRFSGVRTSSLVVTHIDNSSEEEEEEMALNKKNGLRELLVDRAKGLVPKDTSGL